MNALNIFPSFGTLKSKHEPFLSIRQKKRSLHILTSKKTHEEIQL
jgi:hypothetical protein